DDKTKKYGEDDPPFTSSVTSEIKLADGHRFIETYTREPGANAGSYDINVNADVLIKDGSNQDVTNNYNITREKGTLTIDPIAEEVTVTITGNSKKVTYSGKPESVTGFTYAAGQGEETIANHQFTVELSE